MMTAVQQSGEQGRVQGCGSGNVPSMAKSPRLTGEPKHTRNQVHKQYALCQLPACLPWAGLGTPCWQPCWSTALAFSSAFQATQCATCGIQSKFPIAFRAPSIQWGHFCVSPAQLRHCWPLPVLHLDPCRHPRHSKLHSQAGCKTAAGWLSVKRGRESTSPNMEMQPPADVLKDRRTSQLFTGEESTILAQSLKPSHPQKPASRLRNGGAVDQAPKGHQRVSVAGEKESKWPRNMLELPAARFLVLNRGVSLTPRVKRNKHSACTCSPWHRS